jgi:hypothetical protein
MKLAEALILRADLQKRIEQVKARLVRNAKVQEGEQPAEQPAPLMKELDAMLDQLTDLIQRINKTNASTTFDRGMTIADALALRDVLQLRHGAYRELARAATVTQERSTKSEVRFKSTVNVARIQKHADDFAKGHRELDAKIQEANWQTQLSK